MAELLSAIRICRDAANVDNPEGRKTFRDQRLTIEGFVALVASAGDPFGTLDLTGGRREIQARDNGLTAGDIQQLLAQSAA